MRQELQETKKIAEAAQQQAKHAEELVKSNEAELDFKIAIQRRADLQKELDELNLLLQDTSSVLGMLYQAHKISTQEGTPTGALMAFNIQYKKRKQAFPYPHSGVMYGVYYELNLGPKVGAEKFIETIATKIDQLEKYLYDRTEDQKNLTTEIHDINISYNLPTRHKKSPNYFSMLLGSSGRTMKSEESDS